MQTFKAKIGASEHRTLALQGTFVSVVDTSANFELRVDGQRLTVRKGDFLSWPDPFKQLEFINESGTAIDVEVIVGRGQHRPSSVAGAVSVSDITPPGVLVGMADISCAASARTLLASANSERRALTVQNLAANSMTLRIGSGTAAADQGLALAPGESLTLETSDAVYAWNPDALNAATVARLALNK